MENNIALTLHDIADRFNDEVELKKERRHREFIEEKIIPYLKEQAGAGKYCATLPTSGYDAFLLRQLLSDLELTVEVFVYSKIRYLSIKW